MMRIPVTYAKPLAGRRRRRTARARGCMLGQFAEADPEYTCRDRASSRRLVGKLRDPGDIHKIKHVIVIMQENRSFDTYFGTYPGRRRHPDAERHADGVCDRPGDQHLRQSRTSTTRTSTAAARTPPYERDGRHQRRQDGRLHRPSRSPAARGVSDPTDPACTNSATPDVMGYHTRSDIPNYWTLRQGLRPAGPHVRAERVVEPARRTCSWCRNGRRTARSTTTRRVARTRCNAHAKTKGRPPTAAGLLRREQRAATRRSTRGPTSPTCSTSPTSAGATTSSAGHRTRLRKRRRGHLRTGRSSTPSTPGIWNPLPWFDTVKDDHQLGNIQTVSTRSTRRPRAARCRRCRGSCPPARSASIRRRRSAPARRTSRA